MVPIGRHRTACPPQRRVTDHRQHLLAARIGLSLDFHQRDGVDAGIGVAPIRLESDDVLLDRIFQRDLGDLAIIGPERVLPVVLVYASKQAVALAAGTVPPDQIAQYLLGLLALAQAI